MKVSSIPYIFSRWSMSDGIKVCLARVAKRRFNKTLFKYLLDIEFKEIELTQLGYALKKIGNYIEVSKAGLMSNKILLRKFSSDIDVFLQIFINDEFKDLVSAIDNINGIKTIIDAGANVGVSSIKFNTLFKDISIFSVEPDKRNFDLLVKNLEMNNVKGHSFQSGIWKERVKLYFDRSFRDGKEWSITVTDEPNDGDNFESISINDIIREHNLISVDLLKIDIEGSEKEVFSDVKFLNFLDITKYIAIEVHEEIVSKNYIIKILESKNFSIGQSGEYLIGVNSKFRESNN